MIRIHHTSTPLDESLQRLAGSLDRRAREARSESGVLPDSLLFDLDVLGWKGGDRREVLEPCPRECVYPIRLVGDRAILGPVCDVSSPGGPCPHCLDRRWETVLHEQSRRIVDTSQDTLVCYPSPLVTEFALEAMWVLISAALAEAADRRHDGRVAHPFYELDLATLSVSRHALIADSLCPTCSSPEPDTADAARIALASRLKRDIDEFHLVAPAEYGLPVEGLVNRVAGMLGTRFLPDYSPSITAPISGYFWSKQTDPLHYQQVWWSGHNYSYGSSKLTGLLEGLERFSGQEARQRTVTVYNSYRNLQPDALDASTCGLYGAEFYERYPAYRPFGPEQKLHWVWGYSFRRDRPILVPEQMVYYMKHRPEAPRFVHECSNGCATGSCVEEAILHGLLELVERDAFMITWHARLSHARIDPWSCREPDILFMLDRIDRAGYDVHLLDMRLDLPFPATLGVAVRRDDGLGKLVVAGGSSLEPVSAIRAAMVELASYVPGLTERTEARLEEIRPMVHDFSRVSELIHHSMLYGLPEMMPYARFLIANPQVQTMDETYEAYRAIRPQNVDLCADLAYCLDEVTRLGMDVIVVDQTPPELAQIGLKTVCVIVPGLLPIDFGWHRQRGYDLPRLRTVPRSTGFTGDDFVFAQDESAPHPFP